MSQILLMIKTLNSIEKDKREDRNIIEDGHPKEANEVEGSAPHRDRLEKVDSTAKVNFKKAEQLIKVDNVIDLANDAELSSPGYQIPKNEDSSNAVLTNDNKIFSTEKMSCDGNNCGTIISNAFELHEVNYRKTDNQTDSFFSNKKTNNNSTNILECVQDYTSESYHAENVFKTNCDISNGSKENFLNTVLLDEFTDENCIGIVQRQEKAKVCSEFTLDSTRIGKYTENNGLFESNDEGEMFTEVRYSCLNKRDKILKLVEDLLSDEGIAKNKRIKNSFQRRGFVTTKFIYTNSKVKALTKNANFILQCLEGSKKLQLRDNNMKIFRVEPLPEEYDFSRKALIISLENKTTMSEEVFNFMGKFGKVEKVTLRSQGLENYKLSPPIRRLVSLYGDLETSTFAVIEFEFSEQVMRAVVGNRESSSCWVVAPFCGMKDGNRESSSSEMTKENNFESIKLEPYLPISNSQSTIEERQDCDSTAFERPSTSKWKRDHTRYRNVVTRSPRGPDGTAGFHDRLASSNLK